jgi:hypothetical protein
MCPLRFLSTVTCSMLILLDSNLSLGAPEESGKIQSKWSPVFEAFSRNDQDIKKLFQENNSESLSLNCFRDHDDELYIVAGQYQTINAPMEDVYAVLTRFDQYKDWNDGMVVSQAKKLDDRHWSFTLENKVPILFVPNIQTTLWYETTKSPEKDMLRYTLQKSTSLTKYDGLIVLMPMDATHTKFMELDAINADWGILKAAGREKVWTTSLEPLFQSDIMVKLISENHGEQKSDMMKQSKKTSDAYDFSHCVTHQKEWAFTTPSSNVGLQKVSH